MNDQEKDKYIALLERFKDAVIESHRKSNMGWNMSEINAIKNIEEFEDTLECNQEDSAMGGILQC